MQAYLVEEPSGKFRKTDIPRPTLRPNHVLVRIKASGVNPLDTKIRAGKAAHAKQSLPAVLGLDMARIVEEVGPDVRAFKRGDEVFGMVGGVGGLQGTQTPAWLIREGELLRPDGSLFRRPYTPTSVAEMWSSYVAMRIQRCS